MSQLKALLVFGFLVGCQGADPDSVVEQHLRSELGDFAIQQEHHFAATEHYSDDLDEIGFTPSSGVRIDLVADSAAWMAVATSEDGGVECVLRFGRVSEEIDTRVGPSQPGVIECVRGSEEATGP